MVYFLNDSTSRVTLLLGLDPEVLNRGIGPVGNIPILEFIWDLLAPLDFSHVAARDLGTMPDISPEGLIMARALVRDGVLKPCERGGGPNGYLFLVPKNDSKASMIVHVVRFNKQHQSRLHSFCWLSVEDLAFLVQVHSMPPPPPRLSMGSAYMSHLNDPFLRELDNLRFQASAGEDLVACHIDPTNAFGSLVSPETLRVFVSDR